MKYILVGNIGLTNVSLDENGEYSGGATGVMKRIYDTLALANNEFGRVTDLELQETGGGDFDLSPHFGKATSRADHVTTGNQGRGRKGVASYTTDKEAFKVDPVDKHNEIVTTVTYDLVKGKKVKLGKITVYRNIHKDHERSITETISAVRKTIKKLRTDHNVRKVVVMGDWNAEQNIFLGNDFKELKHDDLYHKHNDHARKTFIDRVFTNCVDAEITKVYNTLENKRTGDTDKLGHKAYLIKIGKEAGNRKKLEKFTIVSCKKLKKQVKNANTDFKMPLNWEKDREHMLNKAAEELTNLLDDLQKKSIVELKGGRRKDQILFREVEQAEDEIAHGKKKDKMFFRLGEILTKGIKDTSATTMPKLVDLHGKLESKLNGLNETDVEMGKKVINELYGADKKVNGQLCKTLDDFKKVVLSTSRSGAKDYLGMTLKSTAIIFGTNRRILRRFWEITKIALEIGHFPEIWKEDRIHFIYKEKGARLDAANWRPITIAPSIGKHMEKIIGHFISPVDDKNIDNFAYVKGKSCLSAITKVNEILSKARQTFKNGKRYKYITFLSLDDISGAFEGIDHVLIQMVYECTMFNGDFKIGKLIRSYLTRKAVVAGDGEEMTLKGKFDTKTSPQGSLLSPTFWRIYDSIFTRLYRNNLEVLIEQAEEVVMVDHVSYADDHLTIVIIRIEIEKEEDQIAIILAKFLILVRDLLEDATKQIGSAINPSKSENVVTEDLEERVEVTLILMGKNSPDKPTSCTFKWLGYFLTLKEGHKLVFDVKKIEARINSICFMRDRIFQFSKNMSLRFRIYKVYIAPYVELYLPLVIQSTMGKTTVVHDLQHRTLCRALNVPITTGRERVEEKVGERSVEEKAKRMASRMIENLKLRELETNEIRMSTRAREGRKVSSEKSDREDYIGRLFAFQESKIKERTAKVKVNPGEWKKWANKVRNEIKSFQNGKR